MAQKLTQQQEQKLAQQQRLTQQQLAVVRMLEMPIAELEEKVKDELNDNPALEKSSDDVDDNPWDGGDADSSSNDNDKDNDHDIDSALESITHDDDMLPVWTGSDNNNADYEEMVYGDPVSFYDKLKEQMCELELTDKEKQIMEYLIGSLDDNGFLRKDTESICDELTIYYYLDVDEKEVEEVLKKLQDFDPAGVGAHDLQECLLIQIERKPDSRLKELMHKVVANHFDEFTKKHWDKIADALGLSEIQTNALKTEMKRLNPKPGASLGETMGRNVNQITPDFIVDTDDDGHVSFTLNRGEIPELKVSQEFVNMVESYKNNKNGLNRRDKEALLFAKTNVDKARGYIEALKQRRHTLMVTMKAIIDWQHDFFRDGDESELKPMILKDIAEKTGLDKSTISRVSNMKYAQTRWGIFPLKFFFSDSYTVAEGEDVSTRKIKMTLKELISKENKKKPLSDDALAEALAKKGLPIARRTVSKYREQLGLPVARLRKE